MKLAVLGKDVLAANAVGTFLTNVGALDPTVPVASAFILSGVTATATTNLTIDPFTAAGWGTPAEVAGHIMINPTTGQFICGTALANGDIIIADVNPIGGLGGPKAL